jgi:hypothetical protein
LVLWISDNASKAWRIKMTKQIQLRGNCPCCGREQAVVGGTMSKHGYTVDCGWFNGVCNGHSFAPMQVERAIAEKTIKAVLGGVASLQAMLQEFKDGKLFPEQARSAAHHKAPMVAYKDAASYFQKEALDIAIYGVEKRIRAGNDFAAFMQTTLDAVNGQPLKEIDISKAKPAEIKIGEKRIRGEGKSLMVCTDVRGARVYWKTDKGQTGWDGSSARRRMQVVN